MKKNGIIPPHFIYFLENEGIILSDFKSGNLSMKDSYDRVIISLPYSIKTIDIQVIFDSLDYSSPPDFLIIPSNNEKIFYIDYNSVVSSWNFKESNTLYNSLLKIKLLYSREQERVLYENLEQNTFNDQLRKIVTVLKSRIAKYKLQDNSHSVDVLYNHFKDNMEYIVISFPLDIPIRSKHIKRYPVINMMIPVNFENFYIVLSTPGNFAGFELKLEEYNLADFEEVINKTEKLIQSHYKAMILRESIIGRIISSNMGLPLEVDCFNFYSCSLYFYYEKGGSTMYDRKSSTNVGSVNSLGNMSSYILQFIFKEKNKIEFQVVDCDKLTILWKELFDYGESEKEINALLQSVLQGLMSYIKNKK
jgi:hypothetical protein